MAMDRIIYKDMPCRIKALTCQDADGYQTTIINSRLCCEQNIKSAMHEQSHENDFFNYVDINTLETIRHKE